MRRRAALVGQRLAAGLEQQTAGLSTSGASSTPLFGTGTGRAGNASGRAALRGQARGAAAAHPAAAAVASTRLQPDVLPLTRVDEFGAISILESEKMASFVPQTYENVDGRRIEDGRYAAFTKDLTGACSFLCLRGGQGHGERAVPAAECAPLLGWQRVEHCTRRCVVQGLAASSTRGLVFPVPGRAQSPPAPRIPMPPPHAAAAEMAGVPKDRQYTDKVGPAPRCWQKWRCL